MEKSTSQKINLGIFVILGSLLFITTVYFIGNKKDMFNQTIQISAVFKNINGLQTGNNVRFSGINVGTVKQIVILNDSVIRVDMAIENDVVSHIKKDALASIGSDGLVGNMIINIIPGKKSTEVVSAGDIILSENKTTTDEILKTINSTSANAKVITDNLVKITNQISSKEGTIGMLINDTVMSQDLKRTVYNLKVTTKITSESMATLNNIIVGLNNKDNVIGTLKDTLVGRKIKVIIANLEKSSEQINKTIANMKDGKGALNYLSNDPKLVKQIDSTMSNINQASSRLNENLEALKHNFLFRGYFKKQEKEKAKKSNK
ncbi:MlaD family protein [Flavobacterium sp.]|jgi:phospholipid/cholesterol/gamma-HCH transport system substrate-binding protein|uniref:MlaD family protein n=1 Tax=Flavobacterium sp. TaxID=239 RepID=UPI0037C0447F